MKKQGYKETTIKESYSKILKNLAKNCDLNDPEAVNEFVAKKHVSSGRRREKLEDKDEIVNKFSILKTLVK